MRISIATFMLSTLVLGTAAWADDNQASGQAQSPGQVSSDSSSAYSGSDQTSGQASSDYNTTQEPGTTNEPGLTTTAESSEVTRGYLDRELIGVKPQVGIMSFTDQLGNTQGRGAYGLTLESNLARTVGLSGTPFYAGVVTGFIFSHLGDPGSNVFGADSDTPVGAGGANAFLIPANLKVGYNVTDRLRLAAHGGGNVVYRSVASSMFLGDSSAQSGSVWRLFPNIGGDVEYALGNNVAIMARPDWTLTPGDALFTGTLALNLAIG